MNSTDVALFQQAITLASSGQKQTANQQLLTLRANYPNDLNLILWTAFTSPNLTEANRLIEQASKIDPASTTLTQAKQWLEQEKAKQPVLTPKLPLPDFTIPPMTQSSVTPLKRIVNSPLPVQPQTPTQPVYPAAGPAPAYPSQVQSRVAENRDVALTQKTQLTLIGSIAAVLLTISAFLPWLTIILPLTKATINGVGTVTTTNRPVEGVAIKDGWTMVVLGLLLLALNLSALLTDGRIFPKFIIFGLGVVATIFTIYELVSNLIRFFPVGGWWHGVILINVGLYLGLASAVALALVGAVSTFGLRPARRN